jgi:hypothetical protein
MKVYQIDMTNIEGKAPALETALQEHEKWGANHCKQAYTVYEYISKSTATIYNEYNKASSEL